MVLDAEELFINDQKASDSNDTSVDDMLIAALKVWIAAVCEQKHRPIAEIDTVATNFPREVTCNNGDINPSLLLRLWALHSNPQWKK